MFVISWRPHYGVPSWHPSYHGKLVRVSHRRPPPLHLSARGRCVLGSCPTPLAVRQHDAARTHHQARQCPSAMGAYAHGQLALAQQDRQSFATVGPRPCRTHRTQEDLLRHCSKARLGAVVDVEERTVLPSFGAELIFRAPRACISNPQTALQQGRVRIRPGHGTTPDAGTSIAPTFRTTSCARASMARLRARIDG